MRTIMKAAPCAVAASVCQEQPPAAPALPTPPTFAQLYVIARKYLRQRGGQLNDQAWDEEDILHEATLLAHRKIDRFVPPPGCTNVEQALAAWLKAIAWRMASE